MYSRHTGYRPFVPMNNLLSRSEEVYAPVEIPEPEASIEDEAPAPPIAQAIPAAAAAAAALPQRNILEGLFGGGRKRGGRGGGLADGFGSLGGITDLLRSGGGGIAKFLRNFSIDWDAGDILLGLILLFLSLEGDDDEILILLGLMLVMGF